MQPDEPGVTTLRGKAARASAEAHEAELLHRCLSLLRNPNGDAYRREHLQLIGEMGLRQLYDDDQITTDELEGLMAEMLSVEPDPLDA